MTFCIDMKHPCANPIDFNEGLAQESFSPDPSRRLDSGLLSFFNNLLSKEIPFCVLLLSDILFCQFSKTLTVMAVYNITIRIHQSSVLFLNKNIISITYYKE